jgi:hypothetical protein
MCHVSRVYGLGIARRPRRTGSRPTCRMISAASREISRASRRICSARRASQTRTRHRSEQATRCRPVSGLPHAPQAVTTAFNAGISTGEGVGIGEPYGEGRRAVQDPHGMGMIMTDHSLVRKHPHRLRGGVRAHHRSGLSPCAPVEHNTGARPRTAGAVISAGVVSRTGSSFTRGACSASRGAMAGRVAPAGRVSETRATVAAAALANRTTARPCTASTRRCPERPPDGDAVAVRAAQSPAGAGEVRTLLGTGDTRNRLLFTVCPSAAARSRRRMPLKEGLCM